MIIRYVVVLYFFSSICLQAMESTPQRIREWSEALAKETHSPEGIFHVMRGQLDDGADVNYISSKYGNPLINAVQNGRIDVIKLLLERGANPNIALRLSSGELANPLQLALGRYNSGMYNDDVARIIVNLLLESGAHYRDKSIQDLISSSIKVKKLMDEALKKQKIS